MNSLRQVASGCSNPLNLSRMCRNMFYNMLAGTCFTQLLSIFQISKLLLIAVSVVFLPSVAESDTAKFGGNRRVRFVKCYAAASYRGVFLA